MEHWVIRRRKPQCATKPISQLTLWLLIPLEVVRLQKLYFTNSCYKWHQQFYTKFYTVIQLRNLYLGDLNLDTTSSEINGKIKIRVLFIIITITTIIIIIIMVVPVVGSAEKKDQILKTQCLHTHQTCGVLLDCHCNK